MSLKVVPTMGQCSCVLKSSSEHECKGVNQLCFQVGGRVKKLHDFSPTVYGTYAAVDV